MIGRIVEVADNQRHLYVSRGFLVIQETGNERKKLGQVPLDDIAALIANAHGLSYTNNLLVALSERGTPFVLCAANHNAVGMLLPIEGNFQQAARFDAQIARTIPLGKRLWAEIVRAKLSQQAAVLRAISAPDAPLLSLAKKVRSGDPDNLEAQGARRYWSLLFGPEFRRDRQGNGVNAMLNYGYTILRAATARAVVAAGLHPTIGIHHSNQGNAMRLVDDLMEPFRPMIDLKVWQLNKEQESHIDTETKRALVHVLYHDMLTAAGVTPMIVCIQRLATSLAQTFMGEKKQLELPLPEVPINLAMLSNDG